MINRIQVVNSCMVNIMIFQSYHKKRKTPGHVFHDGATFSR